jgi:uncharacterized damage-inducible protein DinB
MKTIDLIKELEDLTQSNIASIQNDFSSLTSEQLNWKSSENSWSINEVLAHLNHYANYYHHAFIQRIEKTKFKDPIEQFISSPLGRSAWKSMKLGNAKNVKRKFKAPKSYNPTHTPFLTTGEDVEIFLNKQKELIEILAKAQQVNLRKVKVAISIAQLIRLRLGDALMFVVYHNERHMQQAYNVLNHSNFPR